MTDVLIIGGGPAGCSAALTLRARGKTVMIADTGESALKKAHRVDNYPGLPGISGEALLSQMQAQAQSMGADLRHGAVQRILPMGKGFSILMGNTLVEAKAVILASGVHRVSLYQGETELVGNGVSYCATCDGMFYRGGSVAVIGAWQEAVEEANFLSSLAKVTYYSEKPHDVSALDKSISSSPHKPLSFERKGDSVQIRYDGGEEAYDCIFILRPAIALSQLMPELKTDAQGALLHTGYLSSVDNVYLAGDLQGPPYQIAKAVGDGNAAALQLIRQWEE